MNLKIERKNFNVIKALMSIYVLHPSPPVSISDLESYQMGILTGLTKILGNIDILENLIKTKSKIDEITDETIWDNAKHFTNPYELIHSPCEYGKLSIASHVPLSRSYFKMIEMIDLLGLFSSMPTKTLITTHIAEGPGGFIEALFKKCEKSDSFTISTAHAITLKSTNSHIPGWKRSRDWLSTHPTVKINYGEDGTGDILKLANIKKFVDTVGISSSHIVTADGGFDFSTDFSNQETLATPLIMASLLIGLQVQAVGGAMIFKIFDTNTQLNYDILFILCHLYNRVAFVKPSTSRLANAEKYVAAFGFRSIPPNLLNKICKILTGVIQCYSINKTVISLFNMKLPDGFLKRMETYNSIFAKQQIDNINATLELINMSTVEATEKKIELRKEQTNVCKKWCEKYGELMR